MTEDRFNELLNGPLAHPLPMFTIMRLGMCLLSVVQATGEAGEKALEDWCAAKEESDRRKGEN